jgi:hypothetical protein
MLGYASVWIQTPAGRIALVIIPALLLGATALVRIWGHKDESAGTEHAV